MQYRARYSGHSELFALPCIIRQAVIVEVDPIASAQIVPVCFAVADAHGAPLDPMAVRLGSAHSEALSEVLPLLVCGEESAVLAFADYSQSPMLDRSARGEFSSICADEARHARALQDLRASLPAPTSDAPQRRALRRFYTLLRDSDLGRHLARIVALDSAACVILGALRQRNRPLGADRSVAQLFGSIHRDEARHVAIAHRQAMRFGRGPELRSVAAETRKQLVALLSRRAHAFESLELCPDRLADRLARLPRRLFA